MEDNTTPESGDKSEACSSTPITIDVESDEETERQTINDPENEIAADEVQDDTKSETTSKEEENKVQGKKGDECENPVRKEAEPEKTLPADSCMIKSEEKSDDLLSPEKDGKGSDITVSEKSKEQKPSRKRKVQVISLDDDEDDDSPKNESTTKTFIEKPVELSTTNAASKPDYDTSSNAPTSHTTNSAGSSENATKITEGVDEKLGSDVPVESEKTVDAAATEKPKHDSDDVILIDDEKEVENTKSLDKKDEHDKSILSIEDQHQSDFTDSPTLTDNSEKKADLSAEPDTNQVNKQLDDAKQAPADEKIDIATDANKEEKDDDVIMVEINSDAGEEKDKLKNKTPLTEEIKSDGTVQVELKNQDKKSNDVSSEVIKNTINDEIMEIDSDSSVERSLDLKKDEEVKELKSGNKVASNKTDENDTVKKTLDIKSSENEKTTDKDNLEKDDTIPETKSRTMVLDEKSGMFEEKEAPPEEKIPQLITGDSDEDVVMVEAHSKKSKQKNAENASKPKSTISSPIEKKEQKELKPNPPAKLPSVDCVNPDCKKESTETTPALAFILNYYGVPKKNKKQRVCAVCYDEVVHKYSELSTTILHKQPLLFCELPRKNELVEISDSSEEEEEEHLRLEAGKPLPPDIIALVESDLNEIMDNTFARINLNQQMQWTEQIMKQKISYNTKLSDEINNELNELQRKVDRIHLQLYSKSRPRYQHLPPCNIFHEVDLLSKSQQGTVQPSNQVSRQYSPQKNQTQTTQKLPLQTAQQTSPGVAVPPGLPKKEDFVRPAIVVGQFYFAVKHKLLNNWAECQVVEAVNVTEKALYKVNFMFNHSSAIKVVPAKHLAYRHSFNVKLPLGTRVIARFDSGTTQPATKPASQQAKTNCFYPGIIAESFGKYNRHRYLIFFDDGYAQYVSHGDVRVVCEESKEVWMDIHPHSQEFIKNYLMNYRSQRPMVQVKVGQRLIAEWKGKWIYAKVVDIDASLVQLHFSDDNRYEWIYRGSTRLGPLYQEKALSQNKSSVTNKFSKFQKRNEPSIEYITIDDDEEETKQDSKKTTPQEQALQNYNKTLQQNQTDVNRSVAKKSTTSRPVAPSAQPSAVFMNSSTIYCEDDRPKGKIVYYTAKKHLPPLKYKPHECNPSCLFKITHNLKSYSPLAKPLLSGWERQLCKMKYKKVFVVYRAPCGRRLRNMYELHRYLRLTKATLNVENFDFDPMIHCLAEYVIENHIYHNPDLSDGREYMAVPCVNYFDDTKPPPCIYSTERIPTEGVNLNLDTDFLCGCDCEDDCLDKNRCQCWQLTIAGAKFCNSTTNVDNIGYVYKRLQETVVTGIYECNARCKCNSSCLNRVVQHPLQTKLQVFKTSNRGWGIRCLNDVSKGSFICIYSGHLLTEEAGNMICQYNANKAGDEYFADLDYIETVEQLKEGYETDVAESESDSEIDGDEEEEAEYDAKRDSDASDDDFTAKAKPSDTVVKTRAQLRRDSTKKTEPKTDTGNETKQTKKKDGSGSDDEREMVNLEPKMDMIKADGNSPSIKFRSVRKLFGKNEQIYIMDAKKSGNLGRYFNHSCNPNLFVQNVFVDTHDLRFPWVAFFALCNVRAGSELTWNYNYDVGSVPGKVLYCQCGAENCRQRLL